MSILGIFKKFVLLLLAIAAVLVSFYGIAVILAYFFTLTGLLKPIVQLAVLVCAVALVYAVILEYTESKHTQGAE